MTTFKWKSGGANILSILRTIEVNKRLSWSGKSLGILAIHTWTLKKQNGKIIVSVNESMEGFLAGLLKKSLNKKLETGIQKWLDLLKAECEK